MTEGEIIKRLNDLTEQLAHLNTLMDKYREEKEDTKSKTEHLSTTSKYEHKGLENEIQAVNHRIDSLEAALKEDNLDNKNRIDSLKEELSINVNKVMQSSEGIKSDMNHQLQNILSAIVIAALTYFLQNLH